MFLGKKFTLAPLPPQEVYNDQLKLASEMGKGSEVKSLKKAESKEAISVKSQLKGPTLVSDCTHKSRDEKVSLFARFRDIKFAPCTKQTFVIIRFRENFVLTNPNTHLPSCFVNLLQDFEDVFPSKRKNKLEARGDGPFQVLEKINDNAYRIDLPGEYSVSATFNVSDLSPFEFDVGSDSRTNLLEEGENDTSQGGDTQGVVFPSGPITRSKARQLKSKMNAFVQDFVATNLIHHVRDVDKYGNAIHWTNLGIVKAHKLVD